MKIKYIDGIRLRNAVIAGAETVFQMRNHLNQINFFPIPDKDTGNNLTVTLREAVNGLRASTSRSIEQTSQILAEGALLAAQGNSGAILAQFFQSLAEEMEGKIKVSTQAFSLAAENAAEKIYKAIANPVEGTIISVIRDWSTELKKACQKSQDFNVVLREALLGARLSLAETKDKIEILRKADVVDAGAQGFVSLLEGISQFMERGTIRGFLRQGISEIRTLSETIFTDFEIQIKQQYCVECLLLSRDANKQEIKDALISKGDSIAIAHSKRLMKIHIHTNQPEEVERELAGRGKIKSIRIHDLIKQQQDALALQKQARIALVTDSSCDLPHDLVMKYHINMVPVRLQFGDEIFIDKQTITPLEFYEKLKESPIHPTTSQPTPADFKKMFERLAPRYDAIICICLAAKLSGTFQAAKTAAKLIKNTRVELIDSRTTSMALGMLVMEAGEAILAGLSIGQVVKRVNAVREKMRIIIHVPTLKYLVKGGRVSKGKGLIATLLNIKPLLTFDKKGLITEQGKAFGTLGSLKKVFKIVRAETAHLKKAQIGIVHANAIGKAEWLANKLAACPAIDSIIIHDVAPVLGVHAGPGTIGVGFIGE